MVFFFFLTITSDWKSQYVCSVPIYTSNQYNNKCIYLSVFNVKFVDLKSERFKCGQMVIHKKT